MTAEHARDRAEAHRLAVAAGWDPIWIRTRGDVRATLRGCSFDLAAAEHVREFFGFLRHTKGIWAGEPFVLLEWQWRAVVGPLFGWKRPDGTRRFRRAYVSCAKKQGKSELAAGIALYLLIADTEHAPEIFIAARDRWQASVIFDMCARMVSQSPVLAHRLDTIDSRKVIAFPAAAGKLEALSADAPKTEGVSLSGLVFDELHVADRALFDALQYGGAARRQPLQLSITTAGVFDQSAIGFEQYEYAKAVLDGARDDDSFFAAIWEAPAGVAWDSPEAWRAANPSIGVTVQESELAEACAAAAGNAAQQSTFERYRCNRWVQTSSRWLDLTIWDGAHGHAIDESVYPGARAYGGLDLASVSDLSALCWLLPCPHDPGALDVVLRCWLPEAAVPEAKAAALYRQWVRDGALRTTPGVTTDYGYIVKAIVEDASRWIADSLSIDRLFQGLSVAQDLADEGLQVFPCGLGHLSMGPLVAELERLVLSGTLHHGSHPVLRWAVDGVEMKTDPAGNQKPDRSTRTRKIDALVALLFALDRYLRRGPADDMPSDAAKDFAARGLFV